MAKQSSKGSLLSKLGAKLRKAVDSHKDDETKISSGGDLPKDVIGIAQLVECKFGQYENGDNKGEYFFYAAGVVKTPATFNGMPIKGMRTQIGPEPMCDTDRGSRKSLDEHVAWVMNEMRKLGAETADLDDGDLESLAAALKEAKPHFKFRTWQGQATKQYPNPRVNHSWEGIMEDFESDEDDPVVDETDDDEEEEEVEEEEVEEEEAEEEESEEEESEEEEEAEEEEEEAEEEEEEEDDWEPGKGEIYKYKPPKAKKHAEVEVLAVFKAKKTVKLKNIDDGKSIYPSVAWDELESA